VLEASGIPGTANTDPGSRSQAIRCLLRGLIGLIHAADKHVDTPDPGSPQMDIEPVTKPALPHTATQASEATIRPERTEKLRQPRATKRAKVEPEVWQDTLTLLCDGDYAVRADYTDALIAYVHSEIPKLGESTDADGVRRIRRLADGPVRQASTLSAALWGDNITRLLNAVHAYVFMLATADSLGHNIATRNASRASSAHADTQSSVHGDNNSASGEQADDSMLQTPSRTPKLGSRSRKTSMTKRILQHVSARSVSSSAAASASDYAHILAILSTLQEQLPVRGLLTGVPMLLALSEAVNVDNAEDPILRERLGTLQEVIARVWLAIGRIWEIPELTQLAIQVGLATTTVSRNTDFVLF
jgi:hypothetical protein